MKSKIQLMLGSGTLLLIFSSWFIGCSGPTSDSSRSKAGTSNDDALPQMKSLKFNVTEDNEFMIDQSLFVNSDSQSLALAQPDLDLRLFTSPKHGVFQEIEKGRFKYIPDIDFYGSDTAEFVLRKPNSLTEVNVVVKLEVQPINDKPRSNGGSMHIEKAAEQVTFKIPVIDPDGDALTFKIAKAPEFGHVVSISEENMSLIYVHDNQANLTDRFILTAEDPSGLAVDIPIAVYVNEANHKPTAFADTFNILEDGELKSRLRGEDEDQDGINFKIIEPPKSGSIATMDPLSGDFTFRPKAEFSGTDSFTFVANDGAADSEPVKITINLEQVNDPPSFVLTTQTVNEDEEIIFRIDATDVEGNTAYLYWDDPHHGTTELVEQGTNFVKLKYKPQLNYFGSDTFNVRAHDYVSVSYKKVQEIRVISINDPPVAVATTLNTAEDQVVVGTLAVTDVDNDSFSFSIRTQGNKGSAFVSDPLTGQITYTPNVNANGQDTFVVSVSDGSASVDATVTVNLSEVNDAPQLPAMDAQLITEDTPQLINFEVIDPDHTVHSVVVMTQPLNGTVSTSGEANHSLRFTPNTNFAGSDTFSFKVSDGQATSNTIQVPINMIPVNDPPSVSAIVLNTNEDTPGEATLIANDPENDPVTFYLFANPTKGTAQLVNSGTKVRYTPYPNVTGSESFRYYAVENVTGRVPLMSGERSISVNITPVNDPPVANAMTISAIQNAPINFNLSASDIDNTLTYSVPTQPGKGTLEILNANTGAVKYTPTLNAIGGDSFQFQVTDGDLIATATVTISIRINNPPTAVVKSVSLNEDSTTSGTVQAVDPDGDPVSYVLENSPLHAATFSFSPASGSYNYVPVANFYGTDSFSFRATDGNAQSAPAAVTFNVLAVNDPPSVSNLAFSLFKGNTVNLNLVGVDPEGSPLSFTISNLSTNGTITGSSPNFVYTANSTFTGSVVLQYRASDSGGLQSNLGSITLNIYN